MNNAKRLKQYSIGKARHSIGRVLDGNLPELLGYLPGQRNALKQTSKYVKSLIELNTQGLYFNPRISLNTFKKIIIRYNNIVCLNLDRIAWLSDEILLQTVARFATSIRELSIAYCFQISPDAVSKLPPILCLIARGCWRILRPAPGVHAYYVVEAQLLALQAGEGLLSLDAFFRFHAHYLNFPHSNISLNLHPNLRPILKCKKFTINPFPMKDSDEQESSALFIVCVVTKNTFHRYYFWLLKTLGTSYGDIWATHQIREIFPSQLRNFVNTMSINPQITFDL